MAKVIGLTFPTVSVSASTASATGNIPNNARIIRVTNPTTSIAYVALGSSVSVNSGHPVLPSQFQDILAHQSAKVAVILNTGTGTIYATPVDFSL